MVTTSGRQLDWERHRSRIRDLYWDQDMDLPEVMKTMEQTYGLVATYVAASDGFCCRL
jgi:hypothetical protein